MRFVDQGIGVEPRIGHHTVDEIVYDGRDAVDTAEPLVKVGQILRGHRPLLPLPHAGKVDRIAWFWSSLAFPYVTHFAERLQGHLRPLSTLTSRFADIAFESLAGIATCPRHVRFTPKAD